jgi:very-short-patch-repair endonuclease
MAQRWMKLYKGVAAEHSLEPAIAALGVRYRWQHPVWSARAFLDFALPDQMIAVEVDGPDHSQPAKKAKDAERTRRLEKLGWTVIRLTNAQALSDPYGWVSKNLKPMIGK